MGSGLQNWSLGFRVWGLGFRFFFFNKGSCKDVGALCGFREPENSEHYSPNDAALKEGAESALTGLKAMAAVAHVPLQDAKALIGEIMMLEATTTANDEDSFAKGEQCTAILSKPHAEVASGVLLFSRVMYHPLIWSTATSILVKKHSRLQGISG